MFSRLPRIPNDVMRVFWLIVDQGIFACSNFITNVFFARWLSPHDYGLFAVSFTGYIFMTVIHWGAFLEPLLVLSAQIDASQRRSFVATLGKLHLLLLAIVIALVSAIIAVLHFWTPSWVLWAIAGAGIGGTLMVTLTTSRRLCLTFLSSRASAFFGVVYFCGVLSTAAVLSRVSLSWFDLWEIMGFWSLVCATAIFIMLYIRTSGTKPYPLRAALGFQKIYAPGAIIASSCNWAATDGIILMLSAMVNVTAVGATKAVFNVANPLLNLANAMHISWLVRFSEQREEHHNVLKILAAYASVAVAAVVFFHFTARFWVNLFYAGRYVEVAWQLPFFVAAIGALCSSTVVTSLFKAGGSLKKGFLPDYIGSASAVVSGFILIAWLGQPGAVFAILVGCVMNLATCTVLLFIGGTRWNNPTLQPVAQTKTSDMVRLGVQND